MRFYNKKWSVLFFLLELSCCCVVQSIVLRSFTGWSLGGKEGEGKHRVSGGREYVNWEGEGLGALSSVCVCGMFSRDHSAFSYRKRAARWHAFAIVAIVTASGFSCKRLFAAGRVTSVLSKGLDSCWRTWSHHFISLDCVQGKSWVFLC